MGFFFTTMPTRARLVFGEGGRKDSTGIHVVKDHSGFDHDKVLDHSTTAMYTITLKTWVSFFQLTTQAIMYYFDKM